MRFIFGLIAALLISSAYGQTAITPGLYALTDCMDYHYGAGNWTKRTGVGQGSDIGPALTDCLTAIRGSTGRGRILVNPGVWLMTNPPTTSLLSGNQIEGFGSQSSKVVYNQSGGIAFYFSGSNGFTGGGIRGLGILLEQGMGDSTAYAIALIGNSQYQPDQSLWEDLYISALGESYWWETFHVDGTARTVPQGVRVGSMHNVQLFRSHNVGLYLANVVQWDIVNVGVYVGMGSGNDVYITGSGTQLTNSTQVDAIRLQYGGQLNATNCSKVRVNYVGVC
jgi:hypothetical protein